MKPSGSSGRQRSLLQRLLLGFAGVMLVVWVGVVVWTVREIKVDQLRFAQMQLKTAARQVVIALRPVSTQPRQMHQMAQEIEQLQAELHGAMNVLLSPYQLQVWQGQTLVYASRNLPLAQPAPVEVGRLGSLPAQGQEWFSWTEADPSSGIMVRVAQESLFGFAMGWTSVGFYLLPLVVSFPFLLLPAWFVIRRGLRPLTSMVSEIEQRTASHLVPLEPTRYRELSPLTLSVNRLMQSLKERLEREQEFLQDAAHELKTPLAVIQTNAESLQDAPDARRRREAATGLLEGVARATHTVHQLLALARTGVDLDPAGLQATDLAELVRGRLGLATPLALARGIEMELDAPDTCILPLHRESACALIDNLIDNAIKYSPDDGRIKACVVVRESCIQFMLSDEGPGIAQEWRSKVFERFCRQPGLDQQGSGLGLAIAQRAAARNQAQIRLNDGLGGRGLLVVVEFSGGS